MNETSKNRAGVDKDITGTLMGYSHEFIYVDARYKPFALGSLAPCLGVLVMSDIFGYAWWWAIIALIPAIPTLFGDLSVAVSKNVARKEKIYRLRFALEKFYHSIPGAAICARALPMTASDVAGLEEKSNNWAKATEIREVALKALRDEKLDDAGNLLSFQALQLPGLRQTGKEAEANKRLGEIINDAELHINERPLQIGHCLSVCATGLAEQGRFDEAIALGQKALDAMSSVSLETDHTKVKQHMNAYADCLTNLAYIKRCGGWYEEAADFLERARAIRVSGYCLIRDLSRVIDLNNQLAKAYLWAGDEFKAGIWLAVVGRTLAEDRSLIEAELIDDMQMLSDFYLAKKGKPQEGPSRLVELAEKDRWLPFNLRLENFVMLAEHYRSNGDSARASEYYAKAYALIDDANPGRERWIARIKQCEEFEGFTGNAANEEATVS